VSDWSDVGALEELDRRGRLLVEVDGRRIGVFRHPSAPEELIAIRNRCPHQGVQLCLGSVRYRESSNRPGSYDVSDQVVIRCPQHGWEFDVRTGQSPDDPQLRVAVYEARAEDGRVLVGAVRRSRAGVS
jgi:3-phenylpropionate/trans-cinnamate dioxygenase ferredoxin subunit